MKNPLSIIPQRFLSRRPSAIRTLAEMENEMDRWLQQSPYDLTAEFSNFDFSPACSFTENEKEYIVKLDIPGIKKDHVNIEVENNRLTVSGERKEEKIEEDERRYLSETYYGSFMRSFNLPSAVNEDKVDAKYEDGVLRIKIPKSEMSKSKKVKIQ